MLRGVARLRFKFTLTMAAYDLIRLPSCSAPQRDQQKVIENAIDAHQTGHPSPRPTAYCRAASRQISAALFLGKPDEPSETDDLG